MALEATVFCYLCKEEKPWFYFRKKGNFRSPMFHLNEFCQPCREKQREEIYSKRDVENQKIDAIVAYGGLCETCKDGTFSHLGFKKLDPSLKAGGKGYYRQILQNAGNGKFKLLCGNCSKNFSN